VVAVLGGLATLVVLANGWLLAMDHPLSDLARIGSIEGVARLVSKLGGTEVALVSVAVLAAVVWRRCRAAAIAIPVTLAVGAVLNVVLKEAIGRPRPSAPSTETALASFPSGHTFQATLLLGLVPLVVLLVTQRQDLARWTRVVAFAGVVAVAASRVVLGAHWPTDVIAGFLVGVALLEVTHHLLDRRHRGEHSCRCALGVTGAS
jgi:undecaprenyl-diphosphatase